MKRSTASKTDPKPTSSTITGNIPVTTTYDPDVFARVLKMKKAKGFLSEHEIIRLAVVSLLDKAGF